MNKKTLTIGVVCFLIILFLLPLSGKNEEPSKLIPGFAPLNPAFVNTTPEFPVSPVSLSHVKGTVDESVHTSYPSYFDLREGNLVSSVKNQGAHSICWTFSAYTSLESCLLPDETTDFSEWHLANTHGFDYDLNGAGNALMTAAYLVRWDGPVDETQVPYGEDFEASVYYASSKHVQEVVFLPQRTGPLDNDSLKYFISNHGPVDFAFNWYSDGFSSTYNSYYLPGNTSQNHRMAVVGWDDNFSRGNFSSPAPGDGAFIARNSWGEGWGEAGYCYISYYDESFQNLVCFNSAESPENYGTLYQYDPLGHTQSWGAVDSWGANIFTAVNKEPLAAVGFFTVDANVNCEIYVYKNISGDNPVNGSLLATQSGSFTYPGFYTVKLDSPFPLTPGDRFSVVVRFTNSSYRYSVPLETPVPNHSSAATANPGESFISLDGSQWQDLTSLSPDYNVCIKAYSQYNAPIISIEAERRNLRAWIIRKDYGQISFRVMALQDVQPSKYILYRRVNGGDFEVLREISPTELIDDSFSFQDKFLEPSSRYSYKVTVLDSSGLFAGTSKIKTI